MTLSFDAAPPVDIKRAATSSYSPEDLATALSIVDAWLVAGPQANYTAALAAKKVVSDGQPYASEKDGDGGGKRVAQKAAQRMKNLLGHALKERDALKRGIIVAVTGKHPTAANAYGFALYFAPYAEPKKRAPKAGTVQAPSEGTTDVTISAPAATAAKK